jgi:hypothetical protein
VVTFSREQLVSALNGLVDELVAGQVAARIRIGSVEEAVELYEAHYRADPLPERALARLRQLLS